MKGFLYGKTEYSLLSPSRLDDYIKLAKDNNFDFLTITDPNMYGVYKFYTKCTSLNIKPIIGLEYTYSYLDNDSKLILYAKNNEGYKALNEISLEANFNNNKSLDLILKHKKNLIIIFPYLDSILEEYLYKRLFSNLNSLFDTINELDAYVGISYTNKISKINSIKEFEELIDSNNIKKIEIHECNYLKYNDRIVFEAINKIAGNEVKLEEFDDYSFLINPLTQEAIDDLVNSINLDLFSKKVPLPKYPSRDGMSSKEFLFDLCNRGLARRGKSKNKRYIDRLNYELTVISNMGFSDYFLIVWDFIRYAKQNNIFVGPGRGSAAGSLVAYTLGITDVDPLEYDLLFERFLNPGRGKMPDIDTDFPDIERYNVINYVKDFYGEKSVCSIITFDTFQIKSSVRDLVRITNIEQRRIDKLIEMIESIGFDKLIDEYKDRDKEIYELLYIAKSIQNLPRHISTHAAGIIISDLNLTDFIPLTAGPNNILMSQFEESDLTKMGFLKMDFLGLRYLTFLSNMAKELNMTRRDVINIRLDDPNVYKLYELGDTLGLFQFESKGMTNALKQIKPKTFNTLVDTIALFRPGPMENIPTYVRRKEGEKIIYPHPALEDILRNTYGIIVYQEQIMQIAYKFAGFTLAEADVMRSAISKKDSNAFIEIKDKFINGSIKNGYDEATANNIYDLIVKFADYGFNKSHSVAYSMLSYYLAWFKTYHKDIFIKNLLNEARASSTIMTDYILYAKKNGIEIVKPNINISTNKFVIINNVIYFPLSNIFSLGNITPNAILDEREKGLFKSFSDFKLRCPFVSKSQVEALIFSGAFDSFGITKYDLIKENDRKSDGFDEFIKTDYSRQEFDFNILAENERKYLGINLIYNIFRNTTNIKIKYKTVNINKLMYNNTSNVLCIFKNIKELKTKKNETMLVGSMQDDISDIRFVIFPSTYSNIKKINSNELYIAKGIMKKDNKNEDSFTIYEIINVK